MDGFMKYIDMALPSGWADVIVRSVVVFIISMLVFHVKEYVDAGAFDTFDITIDSLWLMGGAVIVNAILMMFKK